MASECRTDFDPPITLTAQQIATLARDSSDAIVYSRLAVKAWDLATVQGYMGHSDISTKIGSVRHVPKTEHADQLSRLVGQDSAAALAAPSRL